MDVTQSPEEDEWSVDTAGDAEGESDSTETGPEEDEESETDSVSESNPQSGDRGDPKRRRNPKKR
jgi:hypothetical protein